MFKYYLLLLATSFGICGCVGPATVSRFNPLRILPGVSGSDGSGNTEVVVDPYAIWQEYAIYIVIAGIIIGVIDFMADRKLTAIGPAIAVCGLAVSVWGVTIGAVDKALPWVLGGSVAVWAFLRWRKFKQVKSETRAIS